MLEVRVSSSWTLFYKIFLPTVWIVFFASLTIFTLSLQGIRSLPFHLAIQGTLVFVFLLGFVFLWFTFMNLKRVEMTDDGFFVTNYFKTYRYTYDSLKDIQEMNYGVMRVTSLEFIEKSSFGQKVYFIQRQKVWADFVKEHPQLFSHIL